MTVGCFEGSSKANQDRQHSFLVGAIVMSISQMRMSHSEVMTLVKVSQWQCQYLTPSSLALQSMKYKGLEEGA